MRKRLVASATALSLCVGVSLLAGKHLNAAAEPGAASKGSAASVDNLPDAAFHKVVAKQCSKCHVEPQPQYVPRGVWRLRIQEMAQRSLLGTTLAPGEESTLWQLDLSEFVRYFEARAPETLPPPEPWPPVGDAPIKFRKHKFSPSEAVPVPIVASVRLFDLNGDGRLELVVCDMGHGRVFVGDPADGSGQLKQIATVPNPDRSEMVDLDKDGLQDLLISDLGDFLPADHVKGSVVWLRQTAPGVWEKRPLLEALPRVADAQAGDFDGDGDLDLVVAAFGWHTVGGIFLYENHTTDWASPSFEGFPIDARPGSIHVPPADLDGDGNLDFVGLLSQQYERVIAYLNRGRGRGFRPETLYQAPTPAWGSSGIQVVDLDGDGDLDVLATNGDTLDDALVKPFHGVRWLENRGTYPFEEHFIAGMPGVHRAKAADMDGDGDLDVVACSFLPDPKRELGALPSVALLERKGRDEFVRHALEAGQMVHPTLDVGDYDGDGDVDLLLGNMVGFTFAKTGTGFSSDCWAELWENLSKNP